LLVGAFIGWLAGLVMKVQLTMVAALIVGIVGSALGGLIAGLLGISLKSFSVGGLLVAIGGACLLLYIAARLGKKR
jgi:uncharacterized membrane protein YeaQ/YmgE (transglycosylase-associated protein family)